MICLKKIILQLPDRYNENNVELMEIRNCFQETIEKLGGLDNCRYNLDLIAEMEHAELIYDNNHESIIERFLYHGTVCWCVEQYDETKETIHIVKLSDGRERLIKTPIEK